MSTRLETQLDDSLALVKRVRELEKLNATLAAEIDRQRAEINRRQLLCDTAIDVYYGRRHKHDLGLVIRAYEAAKERG